MRKIILYMATSIDGYVASDDGGVDWLETDVDLGDDEIAFESFMNRIDTILMGRKSYVQNLTFGDWAFGKHQTIVFSSSAFKPSTPNTVVVTDPSVDFVNNLKKREGKDIWLFGGGNLNHFFLENDLIDDIMLFVQPVALGSGIGIFGHKPVDLKKFSRKETRELGGGFTLLWYQR